MTTAPFAPAANTTYVIGHRNPDADAICSAIAYASYKEARGEKGVVAARCGNSNARIDAILHRFRQPLPVYLSDVSPRVRDLMVANVATIPETATCAEALELIDRHDVGLLPVVDAERRVVGTISLPHLGGIFIPRVSQPKLMRQVHGTLANIARALKATGHPRRGRLQARGTLCAGGHHGHPLLLEDFREGGHSRVAVPDHRRRPPGDPAARHRARSARDHHHERHAGGGRGR